MLGSGFTGYKSSSLYIDIPSILHPFPESNSYTPRAELNPFTSQYILASHAYTKDPRPRYHGLMDSTTYALRIANIRIRNSRITQVLSLSLHLPHIATRASRQRPKIIGYCNSSPFSVIREIAKSAVMALIWRKPTDLDCSACPSMVGPERADHDVVCSFGKVRDTFDTTHI